MGIRSWWNNVTISKKLYSIVGTMAVLIVSELFVLNFTMETLSAVRAFVASESIWSKAQNNASIEFSRYVNTKNEKNFERFLESFAVPEADHLLRLELEKEKINIARIKELMKEGKMHPDDMDPIIHLFRRFYRFRYLSEAVEYWKNGDELIAQFKNTGIQYHQLILAGSKDTAKLNELIKEIYRLEIELKSLETGFSNVLSEGSRFLEKTITTLLFSLVILVEGIGIALIIRTTRYITHSLDELNAATKRISDGNFNSSVKVSSTDEIGTLGESVNRMARMLDESQQGLEKKIEARTAELNQTLEENKRLYQESENSLAMRDQFISIASHELRTPLTNLQLQLHLLNRMLKNPTADADPARFSEGCITQVQRLGSLVNELMDLTQIKNGKLELHKKECNLSADALEYTNALQEMAKKFGNTINVKTSGDLIGKFDCNRIGQVITNLVSNAIKYSDGKPIEVSVMQKDGNGIIEVSDNGPGIPPDKLELIFNRFERANTDSTIKGLGLGLYISREIVHQHGGTISVKSELGKGSTFTVAFPLN